MKLSLLTAKQNILRQEQESEKRLTKERRYVNALLLSAGAGKRKRDMSADQKAKVKEARKKSFENGNELKSAMEKITDPTIKKALTKLALRGEWTDKFLFSGFNEKLEWVKTLLTRINNKSREHSKDLKKLQNDIKLLREKIGAAEAMTNLGSGSGSGSTSRKRPRGQLKL